MRRSRSVTTDAQLGDQRVRQRSSRHVVLIGDMPDNLVLALDRRGAALTAARDLSEAFVVLARCAEPSAGSPVDVVVLEPECDGHAIDFLHALKEPEADHLHTIASLYGAPGKSPFLRGVRPPSLEGLESLRRRYEFVPFVVLPRDARPQYQVVVRLPDLREERSVDKLPVVSTIMSISAAEFLAKGSALA